MRELKWIRCFESYETSIEILNWNICQNWSFLTDSLFWLISLFPEKNILSNISHPSLVLACVAVPPSHCSRNECWIPFLLLHILYSRWLRNGSKNTCLIKILYYFLSSVSANLTQPFSFTLLSQYYQFFHPVLFTWAVYINLPISYM